MICADLGIETVCMNTRETAVCEKDGWTQDQVKKALRENHWCFSGLNGGYYESTLDESERQQ